MARAMLVAGLAAFLSLPLWAQSQASSGEAQQATVGASSPEISGLASQSAIFLKDVRLSGNTVFSADELRPLVQPYLNRTVTAQELHELRQKLTLFYVQRGYINSGAVIPSQTAEDGVVAIAIREGRLSDIRINGTDRLQPSYIADRIAVADDRPLNVNTLQESLLQLKRNPLLRSINAHLKPGMRPGESLLEVEVEEARPYHLGIAVDNSRPPSIGAIHAGIEATHQNLTGHGDSLRALIGRSDGLTDGEVDYFLPVSRNDATLGLHYRNNDAIVVEDQFKDLDIKSRAGSAGVSFRYPLIKSLEREFALGLKAERKWSETSLLGVPFSFAAGPQDGKSVIAALRFSQEWLQLSAERVVSLRSTLSLGMHALGATVNPAPPDGRFLNWLGQFQWAEKINSRGDSLHFRSNLQLTRDPLLALEKFAFGGFSTVRGYRENQLVRDNAFTATVEGRFFLPFQRFDNSGEKQLQIVPFLDFGRGWNKDADTPDPRHIASVGLGMEWNPWKNVYGRLYYGYALNKIRNSGYDLQDSGIHFRFGIDLF